MAGVSTGQGSKDDKLNVELSLVPFIDLLSSLVLFLLLSAVWVQMGALPTRAQSPGKSEISQVERNKLVVLLSERKIQLTWPAELSGKMPSVTDKFENIEKQLGQLIQDKKVLTASVSGTDGVTYGQVVQLIDQLKTAGLTSVGLSTN